MTKKKKLIREKKDALEWIIFGNYPTHSVKFGAMPTHGDKGFEQFGLGQGQWIWLDPRHLFMLLSHL